VASQDEVARNPRSRSAKLRIIEKIWTPLHLQTTCTTKLRSYSW
jgi:hypothetical protein